MRKAINIFTLLFFIWLLLDAFNVGDAVLYFLLVGAIPGTSYSLSPSFMFGAMVGFGAIILFEILTRHIKTLGRVRQHMRQFIARHNHLPKRRFNRA